MNNGNRPNAGLSFLEGKRSLPTDPPIDPTLLELEHEYSRRELERQRRRRRWRQQSIYWGACVVAWVLGALLLVLARLEIIP